MPKCSEIDALVTPYVDGQLAGEQHRLVEQHLRVCPPCYKRAEAERAVSELITTRKPELSKRCAPDALHLACAKLAAGEFSSDAKPVDWSTRFVPLAVAATLVLVVGGGSVYKLTDSSPQVMAAELAADHVKCFSVLNSVLGTHHTAEDVEGEMRTRFGWDMHLPREASAAGLELVGSRPCIYGEGKIAHIMYRHNGEPLSLFMLPGSTRASQVVEALGHEAAIWCDRNRTYVLVSREPRPEVARMATFVQASLR
jgi:anti-sigma factor RsiW